MRQIAITMFAIETDMHRYHQWIVDNRVASLRVELCMLAQ